MSDEPVLTFVVPLRHPDTTARYDRVEALLDTTLRALQGQHDGRFAVVVVANRAYVPPPELRYPVTSLAVGHPPAPDWREWGARRFAGVRLDKGGKYGVAMAHVHTPYVMYLDADDFVHHDLVGFVAEHAGRPGWYVGHGVRYDAAAGLWAPVRRFNEVCGTSLVFRRELLPRPGVTAEMTRAEVIDAYGEDVALHEMGSHHHLSRRYRLAELPFRGAMYVTNHGQNASSKADLDWGLPMTASMAARYGIERHATGPMWRAAAARAVPGLTRAGWRNTRGWVWRRKLALQGRLDEAAPQSS